MSDYMSDLSSLYGVQQNAAITASNSTNKKAGSDLDMDGFLKLMVASFQNQSIDDTADTSEMLNQMVQMSVIQAISSLTTLISDSTNLSYAASLVGKEVTIGQRTGTEITGELLGTVTGTGTLNGKQVVFLDNEDTPYELTEIMAVGRLPGGEAAAPVSSALAKQSTNAVEDVAERIYQETMRKIAEGTQAAAAVVNTPTETPGNEPAEEEAAGTVTEPAEDVPEESAELTAEAYEEAAEEVYEES